MISHLFVFSLENHIRIVLESSDSNPDTKEVIFRLDHVKALSASLICRF